MRSRGPLDLHELTTLDEFRAVAGLTVGVIVITDTTGRKAHRPSCRTISEEAFKEKVVLNSGRNGRYYFFLRLEDGTRLLDAQPCRVCL